jgi:hypothetical protein
MRGDLVHALAELGVGVRQEGGPDALVGGRPGVPAVLGPVHAAGGHGDQDAVRVGRMRQDRVDRLASVTRIPLRPVRVIPQRADDLEPNSPIFRAEQRRRLCSGVDDVRLTRWLEQAPVAPPAIRFDAALRLFFGHVSSPERLRAVLAEHQRHLEDMLRQLRDVRAMLGTDPTLALPRIIADWGEHLYSHEADAVRQADAALSELTLPPGPVTVPPGTITPGSGPEQ